MVGEALYHHTLMILRNRGNDSDGSNINSRKWVKSACGIQIGDNGDEWKTISITHWWMYLKDSFATHVLVRSFGIYDISMGYTRGLDPRKTLRIGPTGNAGVVAMSVLVETIEGIDG